MADSYNITPDEVRFRLRTMAVIEVSDNLLNSVAFIPFADQWIDKMLGRQSKTFTGLDTGDQIIAKTAEIAFVAQKVVASPPRGDSETGPIKIKNVKASDLERIALLLEQEWKDCLSELGIPLQQMYFTSAGGDDYSLTGQVLTNNKTVFEL